MGSAIQEATPTSVPAVVEGVGETTPAAVQSVGEASPVPVFTPRPRSGQGLWSALSRGSQLAVLVVMLLVFIVVIGLLWRRLRRQGRVR